MTNLDNNLAVSATNLRKNYKGIAAVKSLSFHISNQEFFGILGPNGAGKSTTIRMLNCSSPPSAGSLEIFGVSVNDNPRLIKSRLGVVPQDNNLDSELTVVENLKIYARYFGIVPLEATRRAAAALDLFQLTDKANAKCDSLSGVMLASMTAAVLSLSSRTSSFSYFVSLGIYPMQLFSGIFFPLSMLPKEFAWVPFLSPIYPAVVIGRNLFNGSPSLMDLVYALWLITLAIVFYIISIILMKKRLIV